jgi:hypothetical protein
MGDVASADPAYGLSLWQRFAVSCRLPDIQAGLLVLAVAVYACFSSPTPDQPGWAEGAVAVLLVLAVGVRRAVLAFLPETRMPLWRLAGGLLLIYGFSVPVLNGLWRGHDMGLIMRDVIPFLFLTMPLFLAPLVTLRAA